METEKILKRPSSTINYGVTTARDKYKQRKVSATREFPINYGKTTARLVTRKVVEPLVQEHSKAFKPIELVDALEAAEAKDTDELLKSLNHIESQEPIHDSCRFQPHPVMDIGAKDAYVHLKVSNGAKTSYVGRSILKQQSPPRKRASAIREYPIGWNNVPRDNNDNYFSGSEDKQPKHIVEATSRLVRGNVQDDLRSNSKKSVMKDIIQEVKFRLVRQNVQHDPRSNSEKSVMKDFVQDVSIMSERDVMNTKAEHVVVRSILHCNSAMTKETGKVNELNDLKSQSMGDIYGSRSNPILLSEESENEIAGSNNKSLNKKVLEDLEDSVCAKNQERGFIVGSSGERMIVQAVMAEKNCPWRHGTGDVKSTTAHGTTRNQIKKQKNVSNTRNNLECNFSQISCMNYKKDAQEHDDVGEKISSAGRRNQTFKRKVLENFENSVCAKNQGEEHIIVDFSSERIIVQALMATKSCPWKHEKGDAKLTTAQSTTIHQMKNQEIVSNTRNNSECNSGHAKKDAQKHDVMGEKISSRPARPTLSVISSDRLASNNDDIVTRSKVKETLRLFQAMFRKSLQEQESKLKAPGTLSKSIHLITVEEMKKQGKWVNTGDKILGHVPGVEIGDEFHYRVELAIIGLHGPFQGGIDQVKKDGKIVATSVVSSGGYDDIDNFDVLVYSGQGGNPTGWNKKAEDQKLERGNLALKNSMDEKSPVRVIRGFKEMKGPDHSLDIKGKMVATYTYDGLYLVERYWQEKGRHGNNVYKFELRRIPGQPELALKEVSKQKKLCIREGLCVDDISQGVEKMRICAVNTVDEEKPPQFKYIANMEYTSSHNLIPVERGCECTGKCSDSKKCLCKDKNGGGIPFNYDGALVETKTVVYECGPHCKCPPSCYNRVSQHGIKIQLEIFKTKSKGWGVRSSNSIPSGSFICEYTGNLLAEKEAEQRVGLDVYFYDLARSKSSSHNVGDGLPNVILPDLQSSSISCEDEEFTIDALEYGNVGRFINHSCSPNLIAQEVLYDHDDKRMPHIMLFASENIPPLQELTYNYHYAIDSVHDSAGNIKIKECYCGSSECTGRMY